MRFLGILLTSALLASTCATRSDQTGGFDPRKVSAAGSGAPRYDQPDAAEEYGRAKRMGGSSIADPRAAYDRAVERREAMASYALARETLSAAAGKSTLRARWEALGPGNIGGRTRVILIDPGDPRILYAAGVSGGVFKSTDEGASWNPVGDALTNIAVNALAIDPSDTRILYAGTGEGYFREDVRGTGLPLRGGGIFTSADGGASWTRLASTASEDFHWVNDLVVSHADPARIYAATRTGVWVSRDRGASWERVLATEVKGGCLDLALRPGAGGDTLFASCGTFEQATVYRNTTAHGSGAWEPVLTSPEMGRTTLAISPSNPDVIYAVAASNVEIGESPPQGLLAVYRSRDGGQDGSWEARTRGDDPEMLNRVLLTNPIVALGPECRGAANRTWVTMGWYTNVVAVDPVDPDTVWVGSVDLFRSRDGGQSWAPASFWAAEDEDPAFVHADQHGIAFHPAFDGATNRTMYVANDGGVFRTLDSRVAMPTGTMAACKPGGSAILWEPLNHGFGVTQFYHGAVFPDGKSWIGGTQDNGTIVGEEESGHDGWRRIYGGDGGYVAIDPADPRRLWVESQGGRIATSADGGGQWAPAMPGDDPSDRFLFITPFTRDPRNATRLWTGGSRMWRTNNRGQTWQRASAVFPPGELASAIAVSPHDPELVLAGTTTGRIVRTTTASAMTGTAAWSGGAPRAGFVSSIAFDPYDDRVAYATYAGFGGAHVWKSSDRGVTWTSIDGRDGGELPDIPVHSIVVDPRDSRRLYIGSDLGVFITLDGGITWMAEREGMPAAVTEALVIARRDGTWYLHAFTHGRGVWRAELGSAARRRGVVRR